MIDFCVYLGDPAWYAERYHVSEAILFDIVVGLTELKGLKKTNSIDFFGSRCDYHIHPEGEPRCEVNKHWEITGSVASTVCFMYSVVGYFANANI